MPSNTARIAKNTLMLYFRQILALLVSLYTVRVVLETLGVEDYGIYNVVSGVVVLFTFLNRAMTSGTQRFLNFALGRNDTEQARNVYSVGLVIHVLIAMLVVILAQTLGLWFFFTWLNIPPERHNAAFVVYQFSVLATIIGILQNPYKATIIAYEKMSFFATLSIIEAALKLGIVFLLSVILFDKLIAYAFLLCIAGFVFFMVYKIYCNRTFEIASFRHCRDRELLKQFLRFSGWSVFGGMANLSREHGANILINIFFGVTLNAAMGIATRVNSVVFQFVSNLQTAINPQIIKSYSAQDYDYFMKLIFRTTKISFCLIFFFVLPLYINVGFVLQIWLTSVPEYTIIFTQLILLSSLVMAIAGPLMTSIQATGDIMKYQVIISCFIFANLPLSLFFLWMGFSPAWVLIIRVSLEAVILIWRIFFLRKRIRLPVFGFFCEVIIPMFIIAAGSTLITIFVSKFFTDEWNRLIVSCIIATLSISCLMYLIGLSRHEKFLLKNWVKIKRSGNT